MTKSIMLVVVCILFVISLVSCGGGSSGGVVADTMTVNIIGPSGTVTSTYTEGSYNTQGNLDPNLIAYVTASNNNTRIELHSGVSITQSPTVITFSVEGNTPQAYLTGGYVNPVNAIAYLSNEQSYISLFSSTTGTITLSSIGNVGEKITGSFDAVVTLLTNTFDTLRLSGTFSVTRDN